MRLQDIPRAWAGSLSEQEFEAGSVSLPGISFDGDPNTGIYRSAADTLDLACGGVRSAQFVTLASGVNYLVHTPATAAAALSAGAILSAAGASTNISLQLLTKGTGSVLVPAGAIATPGIAITGDADTGIYGSAANTLNVVCGGVDAVLINTLASGVNYATITPATNAAAASAGVILGAAGASTNIGLQLLPKGTGAVLMPAGAVGTPGVTVLGDLDTGLYWSGANVMDVAAGGVQVISFTTTGSGVNYATVAPATAAAAATTGVVLGAAGASTDVSLQLLPKGAGQVIVPAGAAATPSVGIVGDLDTGFYGSAANTLVLVTGATAALTIGSAAAPASVGTTPGTAAAALLSATGATGGASSIATTGVGGAGGALALNGGAGGVAAAAATASTGGAGGALTLTGGTGGAANNAANVGTNLGGTGGVVSYIGGTGGAAANGTDTGGAGGSALVAGGTGGAGDTGGVGGTVYVVGGAAGAGGAPAAGDVFLAATLAAAGSRGNVQVGHANTSTSVLKVPDGSAGAPSLTFTSDPNTGLYNAAANSLGIASNGANVATFAAALTTLATVTQFGSVASAALLHGAGATDQAGAAVSAAAGKFMSYYLSATATTGTSRGIYCRLYLGADSAARGDGEAGRFYTTSVGTGGEGIHGAHCSVDLGTNGTATGLACGVRGTAHIKNAAAIAGTWAGCQGEVWSDGASSALAGVASMFRGVLDGDTTALDTGVYAFDFSVPAGNLATGKLAYANTAATGNHAASLRCRLNGTTYYLYLFPVEA